MKTSPAIALILTLPGDGAPRVAGGGMTAYTSQPDGIHFRRFGGYLAGPWLG